MYSSDNKYKIIEIELTAESFLYKMIRILIGTCVDVAKNRIDLKEIEKMFACPPDYYDRVRATVLKPDGLILKRVNYDDKDFDYNEIDYESFEKFKQNKINENN